ncbi:DUF3037 domain-containing protein [Ktedonosporobacter rubrisoli]|uniref:DUF3037 domain-containing protein n=1 Tax=Ktedonosporobacter rubrisoli TaxID=2509675 RepID=A0A4P6JWR1_KTERU|nr:DUF3037 domain-containing protein [Ktedonosporobacter rubrisoli]QBD80157.1 DUF3037 domain-containing protein [Ktedonosporobacter rubrisoli]
MRAPVSYDYALIRVVPRVERGECINVGVILFCRMHRFLGALTHLDAARLQVLAPDLDLTEVQCHLEAIPLLCAGDARAGSLSQLSQPERFHWLVAPRSTIIQTSAVHSGLCNDPEATLHHLLKTMVLL